LVNINKSLRIVLRQSKVNLEWLLVISIIPRKTSFQKTTYRMETKVGKMATMHQKEPKLLKQTLRMIVYQTLALIPDLSTPMFKLMETTISFNKISQVGRSGISTQLVK
jgi:hypothetical protein